MIGIEGQKVGLGTGVIYAVAALVIAFLIAPVVIIVIVSFGETEYLVFPPDELSLRWYKQVFGDPEWMSAMWVSVKVATIAAVSATSLSIPASLALVRGRLGMKGPMYAFILSPLIVPIIITAIGLYFFFSRLIGTGSVIAMGLGHGVLSVPVVTIIITATLQGIDENLERAAVSLGAGRGYTLWHVTLPLISPGLIAAFLFAFLLSFDELLIPLFLSGIMVQTLSVKIWESIQYELSPVIAAVSSILVAATVLVFVLSALARRQIGNSSKRRGVGP